MPRGRQRKLNTMKSSNASRSNNRTTLIKRPRGRPIRIPQPSSDSTAKSKVHKIPERFQQYSQQNITAYAARKEQKRKKPLYV